MIAQLWYSLASAGAALVAGFVAGYMAWGRAVRVHAAGQSSPMACLPLLAGVVAGLAVILALLPGLMAPHDKFYTPHDVIGIVLAVSVSVILLFCWYFYPKYLPAVFSPGMRWCVHFVFELVACVCVSLAGVRFSVLSPIPGTEVGLGAWAWPATIVWMLVAMNVVKLLDGLEGAASVLLLVAAVAVFHTTLGTQEHFLNAFAAVLAGASLASLRFTAYPARMSLRGAGSSVAGFLFAVLTVLARQKTVATLLLVFPLILVVILVGGIVLGGLERILFSDREGQ